MYRLIKLVKTMHSDFSNVINGAGHILRDDLTSSREAADIALEGRLFHSLAVLGRKEFE